MAEYPYVLANGKIPDLFDKIAVAAKPDKFSQDFLEKIGFTSSNDRNFTPLLRKMAFLSEANIPTQRYDLLRDSTQRGGAIAAGIKDAYADLFSVNTTINTASSAEIKGAISRTSGYPESTVDRVYTTFAALCKLANFSGSILAHNNQSGVDTKNPPEPVAPPKLHTNDTTLEKGTSIGKSLHYNIHIHLPATTDISVYNAIFKSLKENLQIS